MLSEPITAHTWYAVTLEPGDVTRYEFQVTPTKDGYRVSKMNGEAFLHTFTACALDTLDNEAPEVMHVDKCDYQEAVRGNEYLRDIVFPRAARSEFNPWTFLAAALAALSVQEELRNDDDW